MKIHILSIAAEMTIINVAGEIKLFCIHEQPMKKPKKVKSEVFKVNSAKLKVVARTNVDKMKQKFGEEFIQDFVQLVSTLALRNS